MKGSEDPDAQCSENSDLIEQGRNRSQTNRSVKNHGTKTEGKRVVGETRNGGSGPECQYNNKHRTKQYTELNKYWEGEPQTQN